MARQYFFSVKPQQDAVGDSAWAVAYWSQGRSGAGGGDEFRLGRGPIYVIHIVASTPENIIFLYYNYFL